MEALILTSALLALAKLLGRKAAKEEPSERRTPPAVLRDPPPPPPREPPRNPNPGAPNAARLDRARALAAQVAQLIKAQGTAYNRERVAAFQGEAGLVADGSYGPRTAGAVKWYTGESIAPLSGRGFEPYVPFGVGQASSAPRAPLPDASKTSAPKVTAPIPQTPSKPTPPIPQRPATGPAFPPLPKAPAATDQKPKPPAEPPNIAVSPETEAAQQPAPSTKPPVTPAAPLTTEPAKRLDRAAELAKQVAESVKTRGKAYDRGSVTFFQREAGLAADGIYGPRTAGAVKWYTGETIAPIGGGALVPYAPKLAVPYAPKLAVPPKPQPKIEDPKAPQTKPTPPQPVRPAASQEVKPSTAPVTVRDRARLDRAAELAKRVAENLKKPGANYDRALLTEFQGQAGLTADGVYGPRSAGAVKWYTGESVAPKTGGRGFTNYVPNF